MPGQGLRDAAEEDGASPCPRALECLGYCSRFTDGRERLTETGTQLASGKNITWHAPVYFSPMAFISIPTFLLPFSILGLYLQQPFFAQDIFA